MIHKFLKEINLTNSSNDKLKVLEKYKDSELITKILEMTYDRVKFTYGVSYNTIKNFTHNAYFEPVISLEFALNELDTLVKREVTGHAAIDLVKDLISALPQEDGDIIKKIIDRDLRINTGTTQINKVHKGLIIKPIYMRCGVFNQKSSKKIKFPALLNLKADGTYREFVVHNGSVTCNSRSGETYEYPQIFQGMKNYPDGHYHGELTVKTSDSLMEFLESELKPDEAADSTHKVTAAILKHKLSGPYILPREIGNGLINSDDVPHDNLVLELWDYVTKPEHENALKKIKNSVQYQDRFNDLLHILYKNNNNSIKLIPHLEVNNELEALDQTSKWMQDGFEGSVLKNKDGLFRDGTSPDQLKIKLKINLEMRITGFTEGTGKNAEYFGALTFQNDEGTIHGKVGVSSMTENMRDLIHFNRDDYLGKIFEVECNDLSLAEGSSIYSLSHPRFIEIRSDKDETDTLEKAFKLREMAMTPGL